jgi:hypothetical protein
LTDPDRRPAFIRFDRMILIVQATAEELELVTTDG